MIIKVSGHQHHWLAGYSFTLHCVNVTSRCHLTSLHLTTFDTWHPILSLWVKQDNIQSIRVQVCNIFGSLSSFSTTSFRFVQSKDSLQSTSTVTICIGIVIALVSDLLC